LTVAGGKHVCSLEAGI